jgi:polyisoprenoid-binding protein YceI
MWKRLGMKVFVLSGFILALLQYAAAQTKYIDRAGKVSFFSSAPMEDIEAHNQQAVSVLDVGTGDVVASMLMRSFNFRKALMEEHFNENYVESHKYPKATFKGKVLNVSDLNVSKNGKYALEISGDITLHGVTKRLALRAEAVVNNGTIQAKAVFPLTVKDFKIEIPRLVVDNIAEVVEVSVSFNYQPM